MVFTSFLFYYVSVSKQKRAAAKTDLLVKNQETTIHQNNLILNELRRANRLLSELAGVDDEEIREEMRDEFETSMPRNFGAEESQSDVNQFKLYVGNIDYAATEGELAIHFSRFGKIEFVNIPVNRYTGRARGFGFVCFNSRTDAERAITLNGSEFRGRQIQVNFAKEREVA